ncbi:MAG: carbohydrate binding family 9 domain-containing protein [Vicinamibacterales bacterium]|nr:carbohydrate binding family 9 domain-containing protein [Vicinamibacterales bacterium]
MRSLNMLQRVLFLMCPLLVCAPVPRAHAQTAGNRPGASEKRATIVRVPDEAIRLDGRLDDAAWKDAPAITDFTQKEPIENAPATQRMEVRFVYDNKAIYVGARMYSHDPATLQAPLGRRDNVGAQAEHIFVSFDTYFDRRTAYTFGVSASGVRIDRYHPRDDEESADSGFDPVWEAKTATDAEGWTAELWIPFAQLRFSEEEVQTWGLNIGRFTPTLDEDDYWVLVPRTDRAWASRFGTLQGIQGMRPSLRMEILPVVGASSTVNANRDLNDPFDDGHNVTGRVGADFKMGLGPNLTLEATFNPDFGQVEADPAEVNLTAFATRFPERRPFFTEGARLLTTPNQSKFFYSRRIGARPNGPAPGDYIDYPEAATILGAGKITGRLQSRTSIGVLAAVTSDEYARTALASLAGISKIKVAPTVAYGIGRVQQEFGRAGSTVSAQVSTLHRDLSPGDPLANLLPRNALTYGADTLIRLKGGEYELTWAGLGTFVTGEPKAMEAVQRSPEHYMQRPDMDYEPRLDPTRTALSGYSQTMSFNRISGRHWLFGISSIYDSVAFEANQVGQMNGADGIQPNVNVTYRETVPGRFFRTYSIRVSQQNEWNHGWNRQTGTVGSTVNLTWLNYWTSAFTVTRLFQTDDARLTRGGPLMGAPQGWSASASFGNSATAQTRWTGSAFASENELGGTARRASGTFSFRPGPRWQLSVAPSYERLTDAQQYVSTLSGGRPETYGNRYVFAYIERSTFSTEFRMGYTLKPDLNLDVYAEPFASSGRYYDYGELLEPSSLERIPYGPLDTPPEVLRNRDFNVQSFQSNVVLRWEWRPGSTMYLVWQQNRDARYPYGTRVGIGDMFSSVRAPGSNIFLMKTSFWIPVR